MHVKVYLSGPPGCDLQVADAARRLLLCGCSVFVPGRLRGESLAPCQVELDRAWVDCCDAVLHVGELCHDSRATLDRAFLVGVRVFRDLDALTQFVKGRP